ncbi:hypothetical protein [Fodinicola acaciae]|uniref:hypothetical protein n=1 Tax=Fodinicola acaciae TaxID=2681555 RepID=UPI0013D57793|nr:hypothetical protein [Fodinicola acaciae]
MEALLELAPRDAGTDPGEPDVEFLEGRSLHDIVACEASCYCTYGTDYCPATGRSNF